jgi:beta-mannosidase
MQRRTPRTLVPKGLDSTQSGAGLADSGFQLAPGEQKILSVFENWHGRVWGRTNCWFNEDGTKPSAGSPGKAWGLGDCSGARNWKVSKDVSGTHTACPLHAGDGRMYNIPMVIEIEPHGKSSLDGLPPNITNLACMGAFGRLAPQSSPPSANDQTFWGTNASYPLSLDSKLDSNTVVKWCPRNWQVNIPKPPNDGMYTYPNNSIQRLAFNPCYSACTERNLAQNYYTSHQNYPSTCQLSEYSKAAKAICLDGYSYGKFA